MRRATRILKFAAIAVLVIALAGFIVMQLWNWLTPALFGWHVITFWQALGILILSKILFGGFRAPSGPPGFVRARMMERWAEMTPEERQKWRQSMRDCGPFPSPSAQSKA